MPYADDKLYHGYLRQNMGKFVSVVRVREILPHLPCLTQSDRDEIEAKRDSTGNYNAMQLLLDCLKRRENWPSQLIRALECCEHLELANEIRAEYESLKVPRNGSVSAPSVNATPSPAPHPSSPRHTTPETQTTAVVTPSGHVAPQPGAASGDDSLVPNHMEVPAVAVPSQSPAAQSEGNPPSASPQAAPSPPSSAPVAPVTPTSAPAVIPPAPQVSPVKSPVQDTHPPAVDAIREPVENSDPTFNQVAASRRNAQPLQGSPAQQAPTRPVVSSANADHTDSRASPSPAAGVAVDEDECFSKPGTLRSFRDVLVPRAVGGAEGPGLLPVAEEPYSGGSSRLQISGSTSEGSASVASALSWNEPEEDHYESVRQSLLSGQDVRVSVGHVSEGAPIPNYAGQTPAAPSENCHLGTGAGPGQRQSEPEREHSLLKKYYIPAAAIAGVSALVMLWRLRN
ncbi:mitochondrial antiviral-signaling protein-like [Megalops cyprinoides]|uniref:mitochondrial antiviral-signaling protein-like n=1 Tax=Megalops cyprinoides TaxID=118141 RepID=UPI001865129A|nr:mitochondrial antiviral-signaling protein-like [Megalops cyprinoides]